MAVFLDIVGSFLIGTMLVVSVMRMNADVTTRSCQRSLEYASQSNAVAVADMLARDLRKAGFNASGPAVITADSVRVRFLADLGNNGSVDTVYYAVGEPSTLADTPNPRDRHLRRKLNGSPFEEIRMGLTKMRLSYFDAEGDSLVMPVETDRVRSIRVDLEVESPVSYGDAYETARLQLVVRPRNLGA
jgi:hypothetical protein